MSFYCNIGNKKAKFIQFQLVVRDEKNTNIYIQNARQSSVFYLDLKLRTLHSLSLSLCRVIWPKMHTLDVATRPKEHYFNCMLKPMFFILLMVRLTK